MAWLYFETPTDETDSEGSRKSSHVDCKLVYERAKEFRPSIYMVSIELLVKKERDAPIKITYVVDNE